MNYNKIQMGTNGQEDRAQNDLYCTPPDVVKKLLEVEQFNSNIWECCDGLGHISDTLKDNGYTVKTSDIIKYRDITEEINFLNTDIKFEGDIITNPPYSTATDFIYKALDVVNDGNKVAMYLKVNFLASQKRYKLFTQNPPKTIYILSKRYNCAKNGEFDKYNNGSVDYCWIIWEKGFKGNTNIKWI